MFTKQYITYRELMFTNGGARSVKTITGASGTMNASYSYQGDFGAHMHRARCENPMNAGVYFGTGKTPPTRDDYKLENIIMSGLSITNESSVTFTDLGDGKYEASASYMVNNTSGAAITISEIAYYGIVGTGSSYVYIVLFERTVLDNPITIPAGETKLITYKLTFNHG